MLLLPAGELRDGEDVLTPHPPAPASSLTGGAMLGFEGYARVTALAVNTDTERAHAVSLPELQCMWEAP